MTANLGEPLAIILLHILEKNSIKTKKNCKEFIKVYYYFITALVLEFNVKWQRYQVSNGGKH